MFGVALHVERLHRRKPDFNRYFLGKVAPGPQVPIDIFHLVEDLLGGLQSQGR